jgi:hypothetical protein
MSGWSGAMPAPSTSWTAAATPAVTAISCSACSTDLQQESGQQPVQGFVSRIAGRRYIWVECLRQCRYECRPWSVEHLPSQDGGLTCLQLGWPCSGCGVQAAYLSSARQVIWSLAVQRRWRRQELPLAAETRPGRQWAGWALPWQGGPTGTHCLQRTKGGLRFLHVVRPIAGHHHVRRRIEARCDSTPRMITHGAGQHEPSSV